MISNICARWAGIGVDAMARWSAGRHHQDQALAAVDCLQRGADVHERPVFHVIEDPAILGVRGVAPVIGHAVRSQLEGSRSRSGGPSRRIGPAKL